MAKFKDSAATQNFPTPDLLWTAVDFLKVGAEVGFWSFQRSGGQQVSLLQQVDWPQGLDLQLWHTTQPAEGCGQLRETREGLQRGTDGFHTANKQTAQLTAKIHQVGHFIK